MFIVFLLIFTNIYFSATFLSGNGKKGVVGDIIIIKQKGTGNYEL